MELYDHFLRNMPLWLVVMTTLIIVLLSVYAGYRVGKFMLLRSGDSAGLFSGSVVTASLGLLAFMLAFTFSIAANRYTERKQILIEEVNAIGTTYLRADFLPSTSGDEIKNLLRKYVDIHASLADRAMWKEHKQIEELINQSELIHDKLWAYTVPLAKQFPNSEMIGL